MHQGGIGLTRHQFMVATSATLLGATAADPVSERKDDITMEISFYTDAFNSSYQNFEKCLQQAQQNDAHYNNNYWIDIANMFRVSPKDMVGKRDGLNSLKYS